MVMRGKRTQYAGVRFRSRVEAAWAGFFDDQGIAWEYEPERLVGNGYEYRPDFRIGDAAIWVEVKSATVIDVNLGALMLCEFGLMTKPLIVVRGAPESHKALILTATLKDERGKEIHPQQMPPGIRFPSFAEAYAAAQGRAS